MEHTARRSARRGSSSEVIQKTVQGALFYFNFQSARTLQLQFLGRITALTPDGVGL